MSRQKKKFQLALTPIGYDLIKCYRRFILVVGPRRCGKTLDCMHRLISHAVECPGLPMIGFIGQTLKNMKASGTWQDLTQWAIPIWIEAGKTEWVKLPRTTPDTKMTYCQIRNARGDPVEFQLHSLNHEDDVETTFKSNKLSVIYMPEADQFKRHKTFTVLTQCLRRRQFGVPDDHHHMILDCNPPEEAEDHWLYREFVLMTGADDKPLGPEHAALRQVFRYNLDNNIYISEAEKRQIKNDHAYDPILSARMVDGLWVKASRDGVFRRVLLPNLHFVGDCKPLAEDEWEYIEPPKNCTELFTAWDIGDSNVAVLFICIRNGERTEYDVFDEISILHEPVNLQILVQRVTERMRWWEQQIAARDGSQRPPLWTHFSDISAERHRGVAGMSEAMAVALASKGEIILTGVHKEWGSVYDGVMLIKRLLHERRLFISARCKYLQECLRNATPGENWKPGMTTNIIRLGSEAKHGIDALRYALQRIEPVEITQRMQPEVRSAPIFMAL